MNIKDWLNQRVSRREFVGKLVTTTFAGLVTLQAGSIAAEEDMEERDPLEEELEKKVEELRQRFKDLNQRLDRLIPKQGDHTKLVEEVFNFLKEVGEMGKEINDPNVGGIIEGGSPLDLWLFDNQVFLESLKGKESTAENEDTLNRLIDNFVGKYVIPGLKKEEKTLLFNRYLRGYICGYYDYCPPVN
jgi:hypothetical protein